MAGSRSWFVYVADDASQYAVELDEDTGSLNTSGFTPYSGQTPLKLLPQGMKMRYVNAVQTTGAGAGFRSRKIPMGTTTAALYTGVSTTATLNGLIYAISSTRGERSRKPKSVNTGLVGPSPTVGGTQ